MGCNWHRRYEGAFEPWKLDLILARAKAARLNSHDLEDFVQEMALYFTQFVFDPAKANGGKETTIYTQIIEHRLSTRRRDGYQDQKFEDRMTQMNKTESTGPDEVELSGAVREAVVSLRKFDRRVCRYLSSGMEPIEIAKAMKCTRLRIHRSINRIRKHFVMYGIAAEPQASN